MFPKRACILIFSRTPFSRSGLNQEMGSLRTASSLDLFTVKNSTYQLLELLHKIQLLPHPPSSILSDTNFVPVSVSTNGIITDREYIHYLIITVSASPHNFVTLTASFHCRAIVHASSYYIVSARTSTDYLVIVRTTRQNCITPLASIPYLYTARASTSY